MGGKKAKLSFVERQHDNPGQRKPKLNPTWFCRDMQLLVMAQYRQGEEKNEGQENNAATIGASK